MALRADERPLDRAEVVQPDTVRSVAGPDHRQIQLARDDRLQVSRGTPRRGPELEGHQRMRDVEPAQHLRQVHDEQSTRGWPYADRRQRPDPDRPAQAAAHLFYLLPGPPLGAEQRAGLRQQGRTGVGQGDARGLPHEHRQSQLTLQLLDRRRDGRLSDTDAAGALGETALLRDRDEVLQLT